MGIKHNTVAQIYNFKQKTHENVRDCASQLRQYIARCPAREIPSQIPSQERLVSLFLEGLSNKTLHANLYSMKHKTLNECVTDAIDLDDNCIIFGGTSPRSSDSRHSHVSTKNEEQKKFPDEEKIAEEVIKKMNLAMRQPQRQWPRRIPGMEPPQANHLKPNP